MKIQSLFCLVALLLFGCTSTGKPTAGPMEGRIVGGRYYSPAGLFSIEMPAWYTSDDRLADFSDPMVTVFLARDESGAMVSVECRTPSDKVSLDAFRRASRYEKVMQVRERLTTAMSTNGLDPMALDCGVHNWKGQVVDCFLLAAEGVSAKFRGESFGSFEGLTGFWHNMVFVRGDNTYLVSIMPSPLQPIYPPGMPDAEVAETMKDVIFQFADSMRFESEL